MTRHRPPLEYWRLVAIGLVLTPAFVSCSADSATDPPGIDPIPASIEISPPEATLNALGDTVSFAATVLDSSGAELPSGTVTWSVAGPVISTAGNGQAVAVQPGVGELIASAGNNVADTAFVTVQQVPAEIEITAGSDSIQFASSQEYAAVVRDSNGATVADVAVAWSSSDTTVMGIDESGFAWAVGLGTADIVATHGGNDQALVDTFAVTVTPLEFVGLESIHFSMSCFRSASGNIHCAGLTDDLFGTAFDTCLEGTANENACSAIARSIPEEFRFPEFSLGGYDLSCGLDDTGTAWCWGDNNSFQLGIGSDRSFQSSPVEVHGDHTFTRIAPAFVTHTCALADDSTAYCWGEGAGVGVGDSNGRTEPTPVVGDIAFATIETTYYSSCGVDTAGTGYCWGDDARALGSGSGIELAPDTLWGGLHWKHVEPGGGHGCGLTQDGRAYCWGGGSWIGAGPGVSNTNEPVPVLGDRSYESMTVGRHHACALDAAGIAYCWGGNTDGQVGNGTTNTAYEPVAIQGLTFTAIEAEDRHTCGLTDLGLAYCWGRNAVGQLGDGSSTNRLLPTLVAGQEQQ